MKVMKLHVASISEWQGDRDVTDEEMGAAVEAWYRGYAAARGMSLDALREQMRPVLLGS